MNAAIVVSIVGILSVQLGDTAQKVGIVSTFELGWIVSVESGDRVTKVDGLAVSENFLMYLR